jgi:hypothetical protein
MARTTFHTDDELDELLSHDCLSGPKYDQIEERVLDAVTRPRAPRLLGSAVACAAAALVVGVAVLASSSEPFTTKGEYDPSVGAISAACSRPGGSVCSAASTLMFSLDTSRASGYLAAYAEPLNGSATGRIWYFPNAGGYAPRVPAGEATVVFSEGVRIGPEHATGRYRVTAWVSKHPPSRSSSVGSHSTEVLARTTFEIQIIE